MKRLSAILLVGALVFGTVGCTNMNKTQQGLLSGAAGGAILGAGLGARKCRRQERRGHRR